MNEITSRHCFIRAYVVNLLNIWETGLYLTSCLHMEVDVLPPQLPLLPMLEVGGTSLWHDMEGWNKQGLGEITYLPSVWTVSCRELEGYHCGSLFCSILMFMLLMTTVLSCHHKHRGNVLWLLYLVISAHFVERVVFRLDGFMLHLSSAQLESFAQWADTYMSIVPVHPDNTLPFDYSSHIWSAVRFSVPNLRSLTHR